MSRPALLRLPLVAALGAAAGLGQAPASLWWAMLLALVAVMALFRRGAGFAEGWAFGAGHFGLALRWITEPFQVEADVYGWMAPFALVLAAGGFALFWGAAFWGARRWRLGLLGLVALWAGAEALRSLILTGFPWGLIGHAFIGTPIEQLAALGGAHGLTLLMLGLAATVATLGASWRLILPAGALALLWVALDPGAAPPPDPDAPLIRIVQPNVPQVEKWDPALMPGHVDRLMALSGGQRRADLVVWPESALTELLEPGGLTLRAARAATGGAPLAFGVVREEGGRYFNSLALLDGGGAVAAVYDKAHLVPFGEYVPLGDLLARFGVRGMAQSQGDGFSPGTGGALMDLPGIGPARPLICYEGIFAEELPVRGERPRLLLLVTNDAWFGLRAGPLQHFALGRLRAIEQGLPLVRSANTGVSAMIDGRGRVLARLPLREAGSIEAPLPPALAPTPYARAGNLPALLLTGALALLAVARRRRLDPRGVRP
jgi:apolipoprotein N-acyltransferase